MSEVRIPYEWAQKAMELALNYGVDSLRVGSYERKDIMEKHPGYTFQTVQLREKREQSRMALSHHLFSAVEYDTADPKAECTNSDTWNCKYCRKAQTCEALNDPRNSGETLKPKRRLTGDMIYKALRESGLTRYHQPDSVIQGDYEKCLERFAHTIFNLN